MDLYHDKVKNHVTTFKVILDEMHDFDSSIKLFDMITSKIPIPIIEEDAYTVYVLELEDSHYYVGKTNDLDKRLQKHASGEACEWTKIHPIVKLISKEQTSDPFREDNLTILTMMKYGMKSVRGGIYCNIDLLPSEVKLIKDKICSLENTCYQCNRPGHYAHVCPERKNKRMCIE